MEELKQKAEEWVAKYVEQSVEVVRKVALRHYKHLQTAYIAGATENGVQWHDLKKTQTIYQKRISLIGCILIAKEIKYIAQ